MLSFLKHRDTSQQSPLKNVTRQRSGIQLATKKPQLRVSGIKYPDPSFHQKPKAPMHNQYNQVEQYTTKELCDAIQEANDSSIEMQNEANAIREEVIKKVAENNEFLETIKSASIAINNTMQETSHINVLHQTLNDSNSVSNEKLNKLAEIAEKLGKEIAEKEQAVQKEADSLNAKENENKKSEEILKEREEDVDKLEQDIKDIESSVKGMEIENNNFSDKHNLSQKELNDIVNEISSIEGQINSLDKAIDEEENQKSQKERELSAIGEELNNVQQNISSLNKESQSANQDLLTQKAKMSFMPTSGYDSSMNEKEKEEINNQISKIKNEINSRRNSINILTNKKDSLFSNQQNSSPSSIKLQGEFQRMQELQKKNSELLQMQASLQVRLDSAHKEFGSAVEELRKQMSLTINAKTTAVQKQNETQQKLSSDNSESMQLNEEISDLTRKQHEQKRIKIENEQAIEKLKADIKEAMQKKAQEASHKKEASQSSQRFRRSATRTKSRILSID